CDAEPRGQDAHGARRARRSGLRTGQAHGRRPPAAGEENGRAPGPAGRASARDDAEGPRDAHTRTARRGREEEEPTARARPGDAQPPARTGRRLWRVTGLARRAYGLSFPEPYLAPAARPQPPRSKVDEPIYRHDGPFAYGVEPT